jgi:hypothetical protein
MRKLLSAALVAVALLLILAPPSDAHGRRFRGGTRVFVGVGPGFFYGPYPYWYYPRPYYYGPYVYTPPTVIVQEPPVYVQQQPTPEATAPPAAEAAPPEPGYWYYCASAREYYPRAATCPEAWIKVPPRQE